MEERNDGALELGSASSVDGGRRERLPHNRLANVCRNEERDSRSKSVSFLQNCKNKFKFSPELQICQTQKVGQIAHLEELVEQEHNETGNAELEDNEEADTDANLGRLAVQTGHHVDDRLTDRDDHAEHCKLQRLLLDLQDDQKTTQRAANQTHVSEHR